MVILSASSYWKSCATWLLPSILWRSAGTSSTPHSASKRCSTRSGWYLAMVLGLKYGKIASKDSSIRRKLQHNQFWQHSWFYGVCPLIFQSSNWAYQIKTGDGESDGDGDDGYDVEKYRDLNADRFKKIFPAQVLKDSVINQKGCWKLWLGLRRSFWWLLFLVMWMWLRYSL